MQFDSLSNQVIGCAIEVHKELGPGLLESTYEQCLARELSIQNISFELQCPLPVLYKGLQLDCGYRVDLLIVKQLIIELKAVNNLLPVHEAQILTYMKLSRVKNGLLVNYNERLLKDGIKRFVL
ncbi:GxxExxY protein [candidate division KSB1 bacterium]|nr:GxxExxY protein [candidate division KSB1 bacterium]